MSKREWIRVKDETGQVLGEYWTPQPTMEQEVRFITDLLKAMPKQQKRAKTNGQQLTVNHVTPVAKNDGKTEELINMCFYAGHLHTDPHETEFNISALVDVGMESGCIPVSVYMGSNSAYRAVGYKLRMFKAGDYIKIRAYTKPWGKLQPDGSWKNGVAQEVVEIRNDPPVRVVQNEPSREVDSEIPF